MDNRKPPPASPAAATNAKSAKDSALGKHAGGEDQITKKRVRKYVEKGSLTEAQLIEDKLRSKSSKSRSEKTEEEKREERRAANRLSAFQSRQRRLDIIEDLQKTVATLTKVNSEQQRQILQLKDELKSIRAENDRLKMQLNSLEEGEKGNVASHQAHASAQGGRDQTSSGGGGGGGGGQQHGVARFQSEVQQSGLPTASAGSIGHMPNASTEVTSLLSELSYIQQQLRNINDWSTQQPQLQGSDVLQSLARVVSQQPTPSAGQAQQQLLVQQLLASQQQEQQLTQQESTLQQQLELLRQLDQLKRGNE